jgi:hypothetical protein
MLAGIPINRDLTLELAHLLDNAGHEQTAGVLVLGLDNERRVVALTIPDRENILSVLDDPPDGLAELRGSLLRETTWRLENGL